MTPQRVQRKRTKGWRMPENTVYVGRPTVYGNEFDFRKLGRAEAVQEYRKWLEQHLAAHTYMEAHVEALRGKHLACWCPVNQPCHADVLLKIANERAAMPGMGE